MSLPYENRADGGRALAAQLSEYAHRADVLVLALPRGGVPVGYEVARALNAPLDVFVVRKLGVPDHEELAMGAIASGGVRVLSADVVQHLRISDEIIAGVAAHELRELARRERLYRGDRALLEARDKIVLLVDDGVATGSTMRAAIAALRQQKPQRLVIGVPVAAAEACAEMRREADEVVCIATPEPFYAVGVWYRDFSQISDDEVSALLARTTENESAA